MFTLSQAYSDLLEVRVKSHITAAWQSSKHSPFAQLVNKTFPFFFNQVKCLASFICPWPALWIMLKNLSIGDCCAVVTHPFPITLCSSLKNQKHSHTKKEKIVIIYIIPYLYDFFSEECMSCSFQCSYR